MMSSFALAESYHHKQDDDFVFVEEITPASRPAEDLLDVLDLCDEGTDEDSDDGSASEMSYDYCDEYRIDASFDDEAIISRSEKIQPAFTNCFTNHENYISDHQICENCSGVPFLDGGRTRDAHVVPNYPETANVSESYTNNHSSFQEQMNYLHDPSASMSNSKCPLDVVVTRTLDIYDCTERREVDMEGSNNTDFPFAYNSHKDLEPVFDGVIASSVSAGSPDILCTEETFLEEADFWDRYDEIQDEFESTFPSCRFDKLHIRKARLSNKKKRKQLKINQKKTAATAAAAALAHMTTNIQHDHSHTGVPSYLSVASSAGNTMLTKPERRRHHCGAKKKLTQTPSKANVAVYHATRAILDYKRGLGARNI